MSDHQRLIQLLIILTCGVSCQWLGWFSRLPSIILLLLAGLLLGPVFHIVDPDQVFGELLGPAVSLAVSLVLFDGGLSLRFSELKNVGSFLRNISTLGAVITTASVTLLAHWVLGFSYGLALLLGTLLIVTGPTVITPLLRQLRLKPDLAAALRWEAIVTDPIGALFAALVAEALLGEGFKHLPILGLIGLVKTIAIGGSIGLAFAGLVVALVRFPWAPRYLETAIAFVAVILAFGISNEFQSEAGLLSVTVMGIALANQKFAPVRHIADFKENLGVLIISTIFIVLAAKIDLTAVIQLGWRSAIFVALLILVARPITVFISALGTGMKMRERVFAAFCAPRGIVAAAVSALLGLELSEAHYPGAELFAPTVFLVIISTVVFYAILTRPLAKLCRVSNDGVEAILFVGAQNWARTLALALKSEGVSVLMVDTNERHIRSAMSRGLRCYQGSVLDQGCREFAERNIVGSVCALTLNDEVNTLAALEFSELVDPTQLFKLSTHADDADASTTFEHVVRLVSPFVPSLSYVDVETYLKAGAKIIEVQATEGATLEALQQQYIAILVGVKSDGRAEFPGRDGASISGIKKWIVLRGKES